MSTCKFFLQGTCKFGDSCRYSHEISDTPQTQGTSIMWQDSKPLQLVINLLLKFVLDGITINAEKNKADSIQQESSVFALANRQFEKSTTQQQSIFTASPTNTNTTVPGAVAQSSSQSIFGGGNPIFNTQETSTCNNNGLGSLIGSNQSFVAKTQSNSVFGAKNSTLATQQNNSPFGTINNAAQQNNISSGITQKNNIFNQSKNNVFNTQTQASSFQNETKGNSFFTNQSPTNSAPTAAYNTFNFATAAKKHHCFYNSNTFINNNWPIGGNVFQGATSKFANNRPINSAQKSTASIFPEDSPQAVINMGLGINGSSEYTKLEDPTENEIKRFESEGCELEQSHKNRQ